MKLCDVIAFINASQEITVGSFEDATGFGVGAIQFDELIEYCVEELDVDPSEIIRLAERLKTLKDLG